MSTASALVTTAVPDAGGATIAMTSAPVVAANVGHQVVHAAPIGAGMSAAPADPPAPTGSRWEAAGSFGQISLRRMRSASPYGRSKPGRLQVRREMNPRRTVAQEAVEHLTRENEEQRRVINTQVQQVRHVSDVALKVKRDADLAEAAKRRAYDEAQKAQAEAEHAKGASWAHHQEAMHRTNLAAEVATESMRRSQAAAEVVIAHAQQLSQMQLEKETLVQEATARITGLEQEKARLSQAHVESRAKMRADHAEALRKDTELQQTMARAVAAEQEAVAAQQCHDRRFYARCRAD